MTRPPPFRVGIGFDAHSLRLGRRLVLGGIEIPYSRGLAGHSDGDVLLHAVTDALLGAAGLPDIGNLFPDTVPAFKDANSGKLLARAYARVRRSGWKAANIDCTVVCDRPRLAPQADAIRRSIARLLSVDTRSIGIKAKTTEGTALALRGRSIAAIASVLLTRA